ncbi:O-antigen ligase [Altererythrobacter xiamenensis]|uniref:O-antigen ligase n=2 Tax=Altererythrobacter xiamenensis TaxID=1316679 RepID=A0A1Y6F2Q5_9SPHN|nr:O-antigen ligase [Altererythrobacter xiamenensis]
MKYLLQWWTANRKLGLLLGLLMVLAIGGGGARADIDSLLFVRPVSAILLVIGAATLTRSDIQAHRWLFVLLLALVALAIIHLLPLPPAIWEAAPGRELIVAAGAFFGDSQPWRPLAMVPWMAWNSLFAMIIPLAALVLAVQLSNRQLAQLLPFLIVVGVTSAFLGLLQSIGPANSVLYFYDITNKGAPVGLFANRNHASVFLAMLIPIVVAYLSMPAKTVERLRQRLFFAGIALAIAIPVIAVSRSRSGIVVALVGLIGSALLYRRPQAERVERRKRQSINPRWVIAGGVFFALVVSSFLAGRSTSLEKLFEADGLDDMRSTVWSATWGSLFDFLPWGSGFGSFVEVYKIFEPEGSLQLNYVNHAHNDYLELLLAAGIPGALILVGALIILTRCARKAWSKAGSKDTEIIVLGRLGTLLLAQLAVASAVDYPVRVPLIAAVATIAAVMSYRAGEFKIRSAPSVES